MKVWDVTSEDVGSRAGFFCSCKTLLFGLVFFLPWACLPVAAVDSCEEIGVAFIWISPVNPKAGASVKIMAVDAEDPLSELFLIDAQGHRTVLKTRHRGGPPWSLIADWDEGNPGNYQVVAVRDRDQVACRPLKVGGPIVPEKKQVWGRATEAFYSAWIEELFGVPHGDTLSLRSLAPLLRNSERNFLYNHLGLGEDDNLLLTPDCADLPYTLRAYFAWKIGLPFAFRACGRGTGSNPPQCGPVTIKTDFTRGIRSQSSFRALYRQLVDTVHSGSARTALEDENTDFYPIQLNRKTLWPGTVFADPYGHVLVLVEWVPQIEGQSGTLLAVDAQPDNTVTRKRFWEGTFLFDHSKNAVAGFKAFRPLVPTTSSGWRTLGNNELVDNPGFAPFSLDQAQLSSDDFFAKMTQLINPHGFSYPTHAYESALDALIEQLETRVTSIDNGETYTRKHPGSVIPMPIGPAIFETLGPWEDYSTPSRDMRLLIAINVLNGIPDKIVRHPELFVLVDTSPEQAKAEIERHHARRIRERGIRYTRSDGSSWRLTVADLLARKSSLEMAYNPNDCVELRWGAQPGTEEYSTCHRQAPKDQRAKMEQYRSWFRETRRPAR